MILYQPRMHTDETRIDQVETPSRNHELSCRPGTSESFTMVIFIVRIRDHLRRPFHPVRDEAHSNQWVKIPPWQFAVHHEVMGRSWLATVLAKLPYQSAIRWRDGKQAARCGLVKRNCD